MYYTFFLFGYVENYSGENTKIGFPPFLLGISHLRIDNSRSGPFWCGRSILRTDSSLLTANIHKIYYLKDNFMDYLMV